MRSRVKQVLGAGLSALAIGVCISAGTVAPASAVSFGAILCTHTVDYAHGSTHVSGTVNVVSTVSCSATMSEIYIRTWLNKDSLSWAGASQDYFNKSVLSSNASTSCSFAPGLFYGTSTTVLRPPAGYSPSSATVSATGASQSVSCNGASRAAPSTPSDAMKSLVTDGYVVTMKDGGLIASKDFVFTGPAN